jgi:ribosome recycling factor
MPVDQIVSKAEDIMKKAVEFFRSELRGVRTGQASAGLVDGIKVEVESYGSTMGLKELGTAAVAEGNVIVIKPFDPSTLKDIQRAIEKSDLGINPQNDGKVIRLPVPPLSSERREQLVNHVKQLAEQQKITVRNARRDANKELEAGKKDKTIPEDDVKKGEDRVQKVTDKYTKEIDDAASDKAKEISEV